MALSRSLRWKILSGAAVAALAGLAVSVIAVWLIVGLKGEVNHLAGTSFNESALIAKAQEGILRERISILSYVNATTDSGKADQISAMKDARATTDAGLDGLAKTSWMKESAQAADLVKQYRQVIDSEYIPAADARDYAKVDELRTTKAAPLVADITKVLSGLNDSITADAAAAGKSAQSAVSQAFLYIGTAVGVGVLSMVIISVRVSNSIIRSVKKVNVALEGLGKGDLTVSVDVNSKDEIALMAQRLNESVKDLHAALSEVSSNADVLNERSAGMLEASVRIAGGAQEVSGRAGDTSAAVGQVNSSLESIAAGAEEMGASIREISRGANEAASVASEAVEVVSRAREYLGELEVAREEIGGFVKVITQIAEQTNLLALNATIEAARAGEAGKGFAVVASEVKELSKASATASEDIASRVQAINNASSQVRSGMDEMTLIVERISGHQSSIASAVEEQTATTAEMSRSVNEIVAGTNGIVANVATIAQSAGEADESAAVTKHSADEVVAMSKDLKQLVSRFTL